VVEAEAVTLTLVEQDLVLEVQVEEAEVVIKDQVELVIQHIQLKVNLEMPTSVVEEVVVDHAEVLVLEQEVVAQEQLSLDFQDHQDLEYQ
tara:strand:- start:42 stop:311 length:270 start_codon:yes stop_codon:yes gene_type:complete